MPPLAISKGDLRRLVEITAAAIDEVLPGRADREDDEADTLEMDAIVPLAQAA
jgi:hypothetical protein